MPPSKGSSHTLGSHYVRSPICAIASYPLIINNNTRTSSSTTAATDESQQQQSESTRKSYAIVAAGGGAASTGVKNSLVRINVVCLGFGCFAVTIVYRIAVTCE